MEEKPAVNAPSSRRPSGLPTVETIESRFQAEVRAFRSRGFIPPTAPKPESLRMAESQAELRPTQFKRRNSKEPSERLIKGWRDIAYVRKTSVERHHPPKPMGYARASQAQLTRPQQKKYTQIQHRSIDRLPPSVRVTDLRAPLPRLTELVPMEEPPTEPVIWERGQMFLDKREDRLSTLKKKIGPTFKPSLHPSAVAPRMTEPWQHYNSYNGSRPSKRSIPDLRTQGQMQKQYEKHIAQKLADQGQTESRAKLSAAESMASMADRHAEWVRRKEERLEQIRRGKAEMELQPCTFKPKINKGFIAWG